MTDKEQSALEKAADRYYEELPASILSTLTEVELIHEAFKAGAEWRARLEQAKAYGPSAEVGRCNVCNDWVELPHKCKD